MVAALTPLAQVALRPATAADREFLIELYGSTRADLALLPLDAEQRDALVRMQYHAQDLNHRHTHPTASFDLIEVDDDPVGRLYVARSGGDLRVIDISLLPEHRNAGLGSALIRALQDEAAATGRTVSLHVAMGNRAARLYERLGFRLSADLGVYRLLEWRAP